MKAAELRLKEPSIRPESAMLPPPSSSPEPAPRGNRWLTGILAAGALLIPLIVSVDGEDPFRYPKELALRVEVILVVAALAVIWAFGRRRALPPLPVREKWVQLTAAICAWTMLCALLSTNRLISVPVAIRILAYALLFVVTVLAMRGRPSWLVGLIVPPAVVNAVIYVLQELDLWSPFDASGGVTNTHLTRTALLGNPNYAGTYLVVPAVVAAALALSQRRWRWAWGAAAAAIVVGIFMTQTLGAILAVVAALFLLFALRMRSWTKTAAALLAALILAGAAFAMYKPLRDRVALMRDAFSRRDVEVLTSARSIPFLSAAAMTGDHPLFGVGPGCFAFNLFDYKLRLQQTHRWILGRGMEGANYGEVHSDHLQIASETGLPGYALFIAALVLLSLPAWRSRDALVRLLSLPLAASFFVLALAQFPLELVAPAHAYLWAAAAVVAGGRR